VNPLICFLSSASNRFTDILDRSEFISNARSARDTISFKACHSSFSPKFRSPIKRNHSVPNAICKEKRKGRGLLLCGTAATKLIRRLIYTKKKGNSGLV
jgi:hypothetical protein